MIYSCFTFFFLLNYLRLVSAPTSHTGRDPLHQQDQFIPSHRAESNALTQEDSRVEASLLQPFVVHRVSAALPVQQLHQLAAAAHKHIHITVRRIRSHAAHLTENSSTPARISLGCCAITNLLFSFRLNIAKPFFPQSSPKFCSPKSRHISDAYRPPIPHKTAKK